MKKSVLAKNVRSIINKYSSSTNCVSIIDLYTGNIDDILSGKFTNDVISFCDSNCSNGHFSRWTNFGVDLVNDAIDFTSSVNELRNS